jgi:hypothetical protein
MVNPQLAEPHIRVAHSTGDAIILRDTIKTRKKGTVVPNESEGYRRRYETKVNETILGRQE